jgi:hypothetical protein
MVILFEVARLKGQPWGRFWWAATRSKRDGQNNGNPPEKVEENVERLLLLWISKFQI